MTSWKTLALMPLALLPALGLAFFGGVLPAPVPPSDASYSDADWGLALEATRSGDKPAALDAVSRFLGQVKSAGPRTRPLQFDGPADVEAFWLNVYDALALRSFIASGETPGFVGRTLVPHAIAGRWVTIAAMERTLRASGDPRIHFALTRLRPGDPPLPEAPFRGGPLDIQLNAAARRFLEEPRNVRISEGVLHLAPLLEREVKPMADAVPGQSLMQLVWTFLPRECEGYPGCVTRTDLNRACGPHLDTCQVRFDAGQAR